MASTNVLRFSSCIATDGTNLYRPKCLSRNVAIAKQQLFVVHSVLLLELKATSCSRQWLVRPAPTYVSLFFDSYIMGNMLDFNMFVTCKNVSQSFFTYLQDNTIPITKLNRTAVLTLVLLGCFVNRISNNCMHGLHYLFAI